MSGMWSDHDIIKPKMNQKKGENLLRLDRRRLVLKMRAWSYPSTYFEQSFEVRTAGRQHHFVCLERASVTCQGHVYEVFFIPQMAEWTQYAGLEVVPPQRELLIHRGAHSAHGRTKYLITTYESILRSHASTR